MKRSNGVIGFIILTCTFVICTTASAFKNDKQALGEWEAVDFVTSMSDFTPGIKVCKGDLYLKKFEFKEGGETQNGAFSWTRGKVYYSEWSRDGRYVIKMINDDEYLFLEWINGDVVKRGARPCYYVFAKKDTVEELRRSFVKDPKIIGEWTTIDFVDTMDQFDPSSRRRNDDLFLKKLEFKGDGIVLCSNKKVKEYQLRWTKGMVDPGSQWPACYYRKKINGRTYLFYQWISEDVTERGQKPKYYVLRK